MLRVSLIGIQPPVWRRIRVPMAFTFDQLHRVIQLSMGWLDYHLHFFKVGDRVLSLPTADLDGDDSEAVTLAEAGLRPGAYFEYLYDMGDDWMHHLEVTAELPPPTPGAYDWSPRVLGGERAAPPEDSGGPPGYERFLSAIRDPNHPDHKELTAWAPNGFDSERFDVRAADAALAVLRGWGAI